MLTHIKNVGENVSEEPAVPTNDQQVSKPVTEYFKGLNGIRAIAAVGVMISHTFQELHHFGFKRVGSLQFGGVGVTIFFTLSGFLITYLLLKEKEKYQNISIKKFYLRRILRIWPLYFFYIFLVFLIYTFVFHKSTANYQFIYLYIFFVSNIAFNLNIYPECLGHLWSISIEEQFYIFWPWVIKYSRHLVKFLFILVISLITLRIGLKFLSVHINNKIPFSIISCMRFDNMAIGALFAIGYYNNLPKLMKVSKSIVVQLLFGFVILLALTNQFNYFSIFGDDVASIITGLFIINQVTGIKKTTLLENRPMIFLGQISYGIYVYHIFVITLLNWLAVKFAWSIFFYKPIFVFAGVLLSTVLVSFLSYQFLEKPFLKLKTRFALIKSGRLAV